MSKTHEIMKEMLEDSTGERLRPVRRTVLLPQADGSVVRRVMDWKGSLVTEDHISPGQRLSLDARTKLGLSQQAFAKLLGISVRTLHDWEQGRRAPSGAAKTLLKVATQYPWVVQEVMAQ